MSEIDQVTETQQPQDTASQVPNQQPVYVQQPNPQYVNPQQPNAPYYAGATSDNSKGYCVLSYLGILWLIGLLGNQKTNPRVRFHVNQGIILSIFTVAIEIVAAILNAIIGAVFTENYYGLLTYTSHTGLFLQGIVSFIVWALVLAGTIIGIVHVTQGKDEPLPVIGKLFKIVK